MAVLLEGGEEMSRFAIAGCGRLGRLVAEAWMKGFLPGYELCGAYSRTAEHAAGLAAEAGCVSCGSVRELIGLHPDYVVETASPSALKEMAIPLLEAGISMVVLSVGALADEDFYKEVCAAAMSSGARMHVASGATGGFDVLQTVALMGGAQARFFNEKGPGALKGTPVYDETLDLERKEVFSGTASEAIAVFPTKVNVTVAASRASVGPDRMEVSMVSTPGFTGDTQRVEIWNEQVRAVVDVYSATAEIAAWSAVRVLRNIASPVVF